MLSRPCTECGEPHESAGRCPDCRRLADTERHRVRDASRAHQGTSRWTRLSARLRRRAPFCEFCGARRSLEVDHILPVIEFPELVWCEENLRVLCRRCNRSRGHRWTHQEAGWVLSCLLEAQARTGRVKYREAVQAAERAVQGGEGPPPPTRRASAGSRETRYTPPGGTSTSDNARTSHYVGHSDREVGA